MLFFGAGTGKFIGIPLSKEFPSEFRKELKGKKMIESYDMIMDYFPQHDRNNNDLEGLYTILDGLSRKPVETELLTNYLYRNVIFNQDNLLAIFNDFESSINRREIKQLKKKLERFIISKCSIHENKVEKLLDIYTRWFDEFSRMIDSLGIYGKDGNVVTRTNIDGIGTVRTQRGVSLSVYPYHKITTNYDEALEIFFEHTIATELFMGFERFQTKNILNLDNTYERMQDHDPILLKIHGSIDWKRLDDNTIIQTRDITFRGRRRIENIIIFPMQKKYIYEDKFLELIYYFKRILRESNIWVICGYSFRDQIILDLVKSEWNDEEKVLILISPNASDKKKKIDRTSHNIHTINGIWEDNETLEKFRKLMDELVA